MPVKGWQYIDGYKFYFDETSFSLIQDLEGILAAPSFRITVDRSRCQVTVYAPDGDNGYIIPYRTFICSPGKSSTPTPVGTFKLTNKYRWHALVESTYGQYCSRLGNTSILFHSVLERPPASIIFRQRNTTNSGNLPPTAASA